MNEYRQIINDFFVFIKKPEDKIHDNQTISHKLKVLWTLLLLEIPVMIALILIIGLVELTGFVDTSAHKINQMLFDFPLFVVFLTAVILLPFVEELIFRLYLRFQQNIPIQLVLSVNTFFNKDSNLRNKIKKLWDRNYRGIFYLSALIFGYIHIINYEIDIFVWIFSPLLILPQFAVGIFIGYARVRYSLILGFFLHALHNMLFLGVSLVSMNSGEVLLEKDTDDFFIKIEESGFNNEMNYFAKGNMDTLKAEGTELNRIIANINDINIHNLSANDDSKLEKKINIIYNAKNSSISHIDTINSQLHDVFEYDLIKSKKDVPAFNIKIDDRFILSEYISDADKSESSVYTFKNKDTVIFKNMNLIGIAKSLTENSGFHFIYNGADTAKYNIELYNGNESELRSSLEYEYGFILEDTTISSEQHHIEFE